MISIVGIIVTFVMVFGGYVFAGGNIGIILHSLPHEMIIIGGASVGAFLLSNDSHVVKQSLKDLKLVFKGYTKKKEDYAQLLNCLYELFRTARVSPLSVENHIENPNSSEIFSKYPTVLADKFAIHLICDNMRMIGMNVDDVGQITALLEDELKAKLEEANHSPHALHMMAEGMPAIGIVAAVLGVIKTMGSIDQPPSVLGGMIGGALVGTFLGVFLSYCFIGPISEKLSAVLNQDHQYYELIKNVFVGYLNKHQPITCIEMARKKIPHDFRPEFAEMEEVLKSLKAG